MEIFLGFWRRSGDLGRRPVSTFGVVVAYLGLANWEIFVIDFDRCSSFFCRESFLGSADLGLSALLGMFFWDFGFWSVLLILA